jgi:hypothetical protein
MPSVQTTIPFTCAMARSHVRANTESLHHTSLQPVKPFSRKLMDVELRAATNELRPYFVGCGYPCPTRYGLRLVFRRPGAKAIVWANAGIRLLLPMNI